MKRYLILPVLAFLGGLFFAAASYTSADDAPVVVSSSPPPPVVAGQSAIDRSNCTDGGIANWKEDKVVTYEVISDSHTTWVQEEMVRKGVESWNVAGGPLVLVENDHSWRGDSEIVIAVESDTQSGSLLGVSRRVCGSSAVGITSGAEIIFTDLVPPYVVATTAAHETGHVLGLGHANDPRDLMAPGLATSTRQQCPSNLDIAALNGNADPTSIPTSSWAERPC